MKRIKLPTCDSEFSNCKHPQFHRKHKSILIHHTKNWVAMKLYPFKLKSLFHKPTFL